MRREITGWYSERLYEEMPIVAYGHSGIPILMVPTAAADFLEYERFHLIGSIASFVDSGKARLYSINSVNRQSLLNPSAPAHIKIEYIDRYDSYIVNEVLPFIRNDCGDPTVLPLIFGISMGGYLAANTFFKHPDLFAGGLIFSGSFDIRGYLDGFYNDQVYFNNPVDFISNMGEGHHLTLLQGGSRRIILFSGQGEWEDPKRTRSFSELLNHKGIPHWLDMWGHDVNHDWVWWRKALPHYLGQLLG